MPPRANAQGGNGQEEQGSGMMGKILQMVVMYVGMQLLLKQFMPKPDAATTEAKTDESGNSVQATVNTGDIPPYAQRPSTLDEGATYNPIPQRIAPMWPDDSKLDIVITVSESVMPKSLMGEGENKDKADPVVFSETGFGFGNYSDKRSIDTTIDVPTAVQHNGTLWGHFFVGLSGSQLDPFAPHYDPASAYFFNYPLTQYIPRKKEFKKRNLLAGKDETNATEAEEQQQEAEHEEEDTSSGPTIANYYHPNASLSFVPSTGVLDFPQTPPAAANFVQLERSGARDGSGQNSWYFPILFVNSFWQLKTHMMLLNETTTTVPLHIDLNNLANWKFNIMATIERNSRDAAMQAAYGHAAPGGGDGTEIEMIKEILLDTNPYLLGVTVTVSIAHMLLEMLAFGSDISHYRKKKDNVGISVRSILANVFMQTVIFLYLVDNSQNTSWMILGSQGIGILIELWKITTVVDVRLRPAPPGSLIPYRIAFEDKHQLSETEEKTKEYDSIAFKYMYIAGVPLLLAYAAYSLIYESHKSWYSYIITTLVGSVYAYGFLMMVPSLYINYRLKSVAHMPGKAMMYKFVNTFIDDLFAFTIKMPILHRLATFRDDIIFFIYLYQRWTYRVDYTRVNEYGQGGDDEEEKAEEKKVGVEAVAIKETQKLASSSSSSSKSTVTTTTTTTTTTRTEMRTVSTGAEAASGAAKKRKN